MKTTLLLASGLLGGLMTACQTNNTNTNITTTTNADSSNIVQVFDTPKKELIAANNAFVLDLYKKIYTAENNQFVSPYSVSSALAMTYAGAASITAEEMAKTMHFAGNNPEFHKSFGDLQGTINKVGSGESITIKVANKLFSNLDYQFKAPFLKTVKDYYGGGFDRIDMKNVEAASKTINSWVEKQTNDKIKDLVKPTDIDAGTSLVLVNAIYFLGNWASAFDEKKTTDYDFTTNKNEVVKTKMMYTVQENSGTFSMPYKYHENELGQWLELPYKDNQASMVVLLPNKKEKIANILEKLNTENLTKSLAALEMPQVPLKIRLPKWKNTYDLNLSETLEKMGMSSAFSDVADFSLMSEPGQISLKIGAVLHKAFVEVGEKGTEAAAATAVIMTKSAAPQNIEPIKEIIFTADHPFVYFIKERSTGSILFMGTMQNPNKA